MACAICSCSSGPGPDDELPGCVPVENLASGNIAVSVVSTLLVGRPVSSV